MFQADFGTKKKSLKEFTTKEVTKGPEIYAVDTSKHGLQEKVKKPVIYLKAQVIF